MVYTPSNAKVFEHSVNDEETIICAHSPCSFVYEPDNGAQDLFFAADGYISQKISISEEVYSKSSTLRVDLKPEQKPKSEQIPESEQKRKPKNDDEGEAQSLACKYRHKDSLRCTDTQGFMHLFLFSVGMKNVLKQVRDR